MYVVGMKAYDKYSNPIRNIYTFVRGPFFTLTEAQEVCSEVSEEIFKNYSKAFPKGTSFLIKEQEEDITLFELNEDKKIPLVTLSARYYEPQTIDNKHPDKITKEMKAEAQKRLATINFA